jgi:RHS repeat-associated protein
LSSILALTDDAGTTQTSYTYEPFGNTTVSGQANGNSFQYTGRENDGTGFYYYRARQHSPSRERFLSEDPIGFRGDDFNLYGYVLNSPTNRIDPSGLAGAACPGIALSFAGGTGLAGRKVAFVVPVGLGSTAIATALQEDPNPAKEVECTRRVLRECLLEAAQRGGGEGVLNHICRLCEQLFGRDLKVFICFFCVIVEMEEMENTARRNAECGERKAKEYGCKPPYYPPK